MKTVMASLILVISLSSIILIGQPIDSNAVIQPLGHGIGNI
ncbi:hypothetical protein SAMN05421578_115112 [Paenibacillus macquariensis]|uniref:Phosphatase n=1 Tax=Paenibacillus macquariensis TaxID=948756 RepID=A0ABY1K9Y8_9BACL|nr:hypothetical protein SAMN05421578_115112 [Paenibacillus macquariensis]